MKKTDSKARLQELISILNIRPIDISNSTGVTKSALSNYLNGTRVPRQDQISKISDYYGLNPAWLMGYDVPMYGKESFIYTDEMLDLDLKFKQLTRENQKNVLQYIDYLLSTQNDDHKQQ